MKIPFDQLQEAIEADDSPGFCLGCGELHNGVEPDARKYEYDGCGAMRVYGAEEIVLMGAYTDTDDA